MKRTSRRALLAGITTVSLAGCPSVGEDRGESVLGHVVIVNRHDEDETVDFRVRWDGELVHESAHELEARGETADDDAVPARTWPDEPGQFTVSARTSGEDWRTIDPADRDYPDCYGVLVEVDRNGRLGMAVSTNEYECSEDALEPGRRTNESVTRG